MPIYADEIPVDDLRKLEKYHVCAECGAFLRLSWSNERDCYMLRCERFEEHNGIRRLGRDPEIAEIKNKLKGEPLPMKSEDLRKQTQETMLARVDMAKFPKDLTKVDKTIVAMVAIEYGLDPLFGELMIYQGRPYVTIDARRRMAQETGLLDGVSARPATKAEKVARRVPDEDYCFIAEVWVKGASHPFEGVGRVRKVEIDRAISQAKAHGKQEDALPIVKDPSAQCEKRAEAQALRRAFHIPLPSFEDIIEAEWEEKPPQEAAAKKEPVVSQGTITAPQRNKIWGDAGIMGYKDEEIHAIIKAKWEVKSVNDLSIAQASTLIDMIAKGEGLPPTPPPD